MEAAVQREIDRIERHLASVQAQAAQIGGVEVELRGLTKDIGEIRAEFRAEAEKIHGRVSEVRRDFQRYLETEAERRVEEMKAKQRDELDARRTRRRELWTFIGVAVAAVGASGWVVTLLTAPG